MITITNILGNIKKDPKLSQIYRESFQKKIVENVIIRRSEAEKSRMRKTSDRGTDIGFILPPGTRLKDQDIVFLDSNKMIVIKLATELVAIISFKNQASDEYQKQKKDILTNIAIKIGHTIGNLHRPLKIENNKVIFPIQTKEEINLFQRLLADVKDHINITFDEIVFEPDQGFDIHEH
ncbi:MAG: urease accessory protein UreE [Candidatus Nitrosocosmicus sp.]